MAKYETEIGSLKMKLIKEQEEY